MLDVPEPVPSTYRSSWCDVDLAQFRRNLATLRQIAGTKALLVVKANAYGHGLRTIAAEAVDSGIDMLGVATIGEAATLIESQLTVPILVMCGLDDREIEYCVAHGVHFLAWRVDQFALAAAAAEKYQRRPQVHIEIDTGMSRSGVDAAELSDLLAALPAEERRRSIVGLASHFFGADLADLEGAKRQLDEFMRCVDLVHDANINPIVHMANSPGTLRIPGSRLDMVRLGVAAYGLVPSDEAPLPPGVEPILSWKAKITNAKTIHAGRGVGYGWRFVAEGEESVATLAIGYADGYHRTPVGANTVLLHGVEVPVVGSVCMDQCVIRLTTGTEGKVGDTVVLLGRDGATSLTAEELAIRWDTNNYDVVAGIRSRVPRRYID